MPTSHGSNQAAVVDVNVDINRVNGSQAVMERLSS
jgi:hypothetical protein